MPREEAATNGRSRSTGSLALGHDADDRDGIGEAGPDRRVTRRSDVVTERSIRCASVQRKGTCRTRRLEAFAEYGCPANWCEHAPRCGVTTDGVVLRGVLPSTHEAHRCRGDRAHRARGSLCDGPRHGSRDLAGEPTTTGLRHVVFDTDLAFDDIMALLYLLQRDDVAIDAVTIAGTGEAHCDPGVRNALGLLALGGSPDTPVACGRETPLQGTNAFPEEWRQAVDDLTMLDLPEVDGSADPRGATQLLLDTLDGDATLITLGPLTNVAEALRADPGLAARVPAFVAMAGAIDAGGNTPNGVAEYNVWVDPLAAKEVVEGMDVTLVPLDATDDVPFTPFFADVLAEHRSTPEAEAAHRIIEANQDIFLATGYSFWDTLATALVFRPELATWEEAPVLVTASQDAGAGWIDRWDEGAPVRFASAVPDPLAFEREYLSVLTGRRSPPSVPNRRSRSRSTVNGARSIPIGRVPGPRSSRSSMLVAARGWAAP